MNLYLTAKGRFVGTQAEAKADGKGWTLEVVPVDKEGLIAYLNAMKVAPVTEAVAAVAAVAEAPVRTHRSQADIDAMFSAPEPKRLSRDVVCHTISVMKGTDLGMVALELAARFESLAK